MQVICARAYQPHRTIFLGHLQEVDIMQGRLEEVVKVLPLMFYGVERRRLGAFYPFERGISGQVSP